MQLIIYGFLALAIMGMIGTGFYKVKQWGANEVRAEWNAALEEQRNREAMASLAAAKELSEARKKRKVIIEERTVYVDKIIDRPVYHNQCLDADGLSCLNGIIAGKGTVGCKPDGTLPKPPPSD